MNCNIERRCTSCKVKTTGCSTWDKNRFAISCKEFIKKDRPAPTEAAM